MGWFMETRMDRRKRKKRNQIVRLVIILCIMVGILGTGSLYILFYYTNVPVVLHSRENPEIWVKCEEKEILIREDNKWKPFTIAGIGMKDSFPGKLSTDNTIPYDLYMDWFDKISEMNANTIRVDDIMGVEFYHALYDYNRSAVEPLVLLHGIMLGQEAYDRMMDAHSGNMVELLTKKAYEVIDIIHGSERTKGREYTWDVSPWTLGYILGDDWDPDLVIYTNDIYGKSAGFSGRYIETWENTSAFETLLAKIANNIFGYETGKYGEQRLLGLKNWARTDPLFHDSLWSIGLNENITSVNTQLIDKTYAVKSGIFAAYHVDPYYPQFLSFDPEYTSGKDKKGKNNPYYTYLEKLNNYHYSMPVIVSDFGVPSSRGVSNIDEIRGYNEGGLNENQQGIILQELYRNIISSGCAGGAITTWHDNWGYTAWNNLDLEDSKRTNYWKNPQDSSQYFGLLAVEPGKVKKACHVDGDVSEWKDIPHIFNENGNTLQMMYDEEYLYLRINVEDYNIDRHKLLIPLDITANSGATVDNTNLMYYDRPIDFVVSIEGKEDSKIMVQRYYNSLYALYSEEIWGENSYLDIPQKDIGLFDTIGQYVRKSMNDEKGDIRGSLVVESGRLHYGNSNPDSTDFDSLGDYIISNNDIEIRIPWMMLNFSDPSNMMIHGDYYENYGVKQCNIDEIYVGLGIKTKDEYLEVKTYPFKLEGWRDNPTYHYRIKEAYGYVQKVFSKY